MLDVSNLTNQEMTLNYTGNKTILIEAKESCRVPVSVERCDLDRVIADYKDKHKNDYNQGEDFLKAGALPKSCSLVIIHR